MDEVNGRLEQLELVLDEFVDARRREGLEGPAALDDGVAAGRWEPCTRYGELHEGAVEHDEALEGGRVLHLLGRHAVADLVGVGGVAGDEGLGAGYGVLDGTGDYLAGYEVDEIGYAFYGFELVE